MTSGSDAVSLDAELGTISDYLDVERARFGDKLVVSVSCEPELSEAVVPGLILQPLVENVIKHAVSAADVPVRLSITAARVNGRLRIAIEDDHVGPPAVAPTQSGVGVRNTRQRLATLYGKDATVETGPMTAQGYRSVLDFPLRYDATL
jgi:LytS/YehU family sensor histidine kinase